MVGDRVTDLLTCEQARAAGEQNEGLGRLLAWVETFPMRSHPDLGRTGAVCPFAKTASQHDMLRLRTFDCGPGGEEQAYGLMHDSYRALERIPAGAGMKKYRAVIVGFPNCSGAEGIATIDRVRKRHKYRALARLRMMGFMYPGADMPGIWSRDFRPMAAPMPVLIIRNFIEQDSLFVAYQRLQWAPYLLLFGLDGARRLLAERRSAPKHPATKSEMATPTAHKH